MPATWMLVVALAGGDWQCRENAGLWDCRSPQAETIVQAPSPAPSPLADPAPQPAATEAAVPQPVAPQPVAPQPAAPEPVAPQPATPPPAAEPATQESPSPAAPPDVVPDPFIVQIGAYRKREDAERQAAQIDRRGLSIAPTRRDGLDWYVLLLGAYPSLEAAEEAGRDYAEEFDGSYWVRRTSDLRRVLREPEI